VRERIIMIHAPLVLPLDELDESTRDEMLSRFFSIVIIVFVSSFLSVTVALQFSVKQLQLMLDAVRMRVTGQARSRGQCMGSQLFKRST